MRVALLVAVVILAAGCGAAPRTTEAPVATAPSVMATLPPQGVPLVTPDVPYGPIVTNFPMTSCVVAAPGAMVVVTGPEDVRDAICVKLANGPWQPAQTEPPASWSRYCWRQDPNYAYLEVWAGALGIAAGNQACAAIGFPAP